MDLDFNGRISGFYSRQLVPSQCIRSRKMTGKNANNIDQNSAEPTEDMSLLVWLVKQLSKYAPFRGQRDPERIKAATKQLEDALEEKCTSRILVNQLVRDKRVRIFQKGHKSLG